MYVQLRRSLCFMLTTTWPLRMTEHAHLILRRARRHFFRLTGLGVKIFNHLACAMCENDDLY